MRSIKQRMTRRSFLAAPAVLAVSATTLPTARAFELFDASNISEIGKAAMLSARHCAHHGFVDLRWLPRPFEADLLADDPALLRRVAMRATDIVAQGSFNPKNFSKLDLFTLPKPKHGARRIWAITEPQDAVTYLTLALLAAPVIEARRIPSSSKIVHSWRFSPGRHRLFDERFTLASFRAAARKRAESAGIVVNCDLANCYGNLNANRIASALDQCGVPGWQAEYIRQLLGFWQLSDSPGVPIGPNASRILAEAVLLQIDNELQDAGIEYMRYVDDFRLFADDERSARLALEAVADAAACQGLGLNADKTAFLHFVNAATADDRQQQGNQRQYQRLAAESDAFNDGLPFSAKHAGAGQIRMLRRLRNAPNATAFLQVEATSPTSLKTLAQALRQAIYAEHSDFLRELPQLLVGYPEAAAYAAAALRSEADVVPVDVRNHLRSEFARMLLDPATPDFVAVKLIAVLSHPDYRDRDTLEEFARMRSASPRGVVFRAALDALRNTGGTTPVLADRFDDMDGWARRALLADPTLRLPIPYSSVNRDLIAAKAMA